MARRNSLTPWATLFNRNVSAFSRLAMRVGTQSAGRAAAVVREQRSAPAGAGDWLPGISLGPTGPRRWRLFRPHGTRFGERLPMVVMLHGCKQDAKGFAASTRMNMLAARERFLVLYPEQDRLSNPQGCWNWFDTKSGRAHAEAASVLRAIDQVCLLHAADRSRIAVAGLSAGASMAALLGTRYPDRFKAIVMHSGVPPGTAHSTLSAVGAMHGHRSTNPLAANVAAMTMALPPLLVIHGDADGVVAARNGRAAAEVWAEAAGASAGVGRAVQRGKRHAMTVTDFKRRGVTMATLVQIGQLGHAWSGGAAAAPFGDGDGPDASRMVWRFAAKQFAG